MKLTNKQIFESLPVLKKLQSDVLPLHFEYTLTKYIKTLDPLYEICVGIRDKIIKKHCKKNASGEPISTGDGTDVIIMDPENFKKDMSLLFDIENKIDIEPIDITFELKIAVKDLQVIDWLFK